MTDSPVGHSSAPARRMTRKQKRLLVIAGLGVVLALAVGLILMALRDQIVFFFSPSELLARPEMAGQAVRIGGLVEDGTFTRDGEVNTFTLTDGDKEIVVTYSGILPDLFREGQGVIAEGHLTGTGGFEASSVLAKHDEKYIPRQVEQTLKDEGHWMGNS